MAVEPPSFIQEAETAWTTNNPESQEKTFPVTKGDWIVVYAIDEAAAGTLALAIEGGGLEWKELKSQKAAGDCFVIVWAAEATETKEITVKIKATGKHEFGTIGRWGFDGLTFRESSGIGEVAITTGSGAPLLEITTKQEKSAIVVANGDFAAADGTTRTWRTVNGITPTSGNGLETTYARVEGSYTVYGAYYSDAGAAGAKTVGLSAPGSETYTVVAIEVKGEEGVPPQLGKPDADVTTTGWTSTPLWEKLADESDATLIEGTME